MPEWLVVLIVAAICFFVGAALAWKATMYMQEASPEVEEPTEYQETELVTRPELAALERRIDREFEDVHERLTSWKGRDAARRKGTKDPMDELRAQFPNASTRFLEKKARALGVNTETQ